MILTDIIDTLKARSIDAYLPGKHDGPCKGPYVVVADDGVRRTGKTTGRHMYLLTAFVPAEKPTAMDTLLSGVRSALASMSNLKETDGQGADYIDEEIGAYAAQLSYSALCSLI